MDRLKLVIAYCIACIPINWIDGSIAVDLLRSLASMSLLGPSRQSTAVQRSVGYPRSSGLVADISCLPGFRQRSKRVVPFGRRHPRANKVANVRPGAVHRTRRREADIPNKGRAAIAVAPHSSLFVVNECARGPFKRRVILQ